MQPPVSARPSSCHRFGYASFEALRSVPGFPDPVSTTVYPYLLLRPAHILCVILAPAVRAAGANSRQTSFFVISTRAIRAIVLASAAATTFVHGSSCRARLFVPLDVQD